MAGAMRKMAVYLGLVEDDGYDGPGFDPDDEFEPEMATPPGGRTAVAARSRAVAGGSLVGAVVGVLTVCHAAPPAAEVRDVPPAARPKRCRAGSCPPAAGRTTLDGTELHGIHRGTSPSH